MSLTPDAETYREKYRERMFKKIQEYRSNPELIQKKIDESKKQLSDRYKKLKSDSEHLPIVDKTTPECPRCGYSKCGLAGVIINTTGKHQRRRCPVCRFVYTENWNTTEI